MKTEDHLPRLACGTTALPGMLVHTDHLGERWEARIVSVSANSLDVIYTSDGKHRAMNCLSRLKPPKDWTFSGTFHGDIP